MIVILDKMNIDLTVDEFIELYTKTDIFGGAENVKKEEEITVLPVTVVKKEKVKPVETSNDDLVDVGELAKFLGIGYSTAFAYKDKGMPSVKVNDGTKTRYRFDKQKCSEWYTNYKKALDARNKKPVAITPVSDKNGEVYYALWKSDLTKMCNAAGKDVGKMLSHTYKYMTKNYGVCWDQEAKDFKEANGYKPPSTTYLAYWLETSKPAYKNLTSACLSEVIKND